MDQMSEIRKKQYACTRCACKYSISNFSEKRILASFAKLTTLCSNCRKYKICPICKNEFKHHQNQTCSSACARELKEKSYLQSEGATHNFKRNSKTKTKIKNDLLKNYGVTNQFAVPETKQKISETLISRYGVDNISKLDSIKTKKKDTLASSLIFDPNLLKRAWWKNHDKFISNLGYDPRLVSLPQTSKESLRFFSPIFELLKKNNLKFFCGIDGLREFCIHDSVNNRSYFYDLMIPKLKLVVEYNHCAWHAKSKDLNWTHPITKQTAAENFEYFEKKIQLVEFHGYSTFVVWTDEDLTLQLNSLISLIKNKIYENKKSN